MYNIRNRDGYLCSRVSPSMARTLTKMYMGEWKEVNGESRYVFKDTASYGNADIAIVIYPGTYLEVN